MVEPEGDIEFLPVNMGQALGVLADIVGTYISSAHTAALADDKKKSAQLNMTMFLHSLLMRSSYPEEMAGLLDILSAELREMAKEDEAPRCTACAVALKEGDKVFNEKEGGYIHADCCGPERESYFGADEQPLKADEPIPEPWIWTAADNTAGPA